MFEIELCKQYPYDPFLNSFRDNSETIIAAIEEQFEDGKLEKY